MTMVQALGLVQQYCREEAVTLSPTQEAFATSYLFVISSSEKSIELLVGKAVAKAVART